MARKLKVFRTSAGFSDAYVAAPSRKAALAAWGAEVDLFARGVAEEVTDPDLMARPLKKPGEVFSVSRGDLAAHLEALKKGGSNAKLAPRPKAEMRLEPKKAKRPRRPPPSRERLDAAQAALEAYDEQAEEELVRLQRERDAAEINLARAESAVEKKRAAVVRKLNAARTAYQDALERWSE